MDLRPHKFEMWLNAKYDNREEFDENVRRVCKTYEEAQSLKEEGVNTISTDEKTGIQALERAADDKPMKPGIAQRIEYEYIRHGTQALIASFEVATGEVKGSVVNERTEKEFAAHIVDVMSANPEAGWIFVADQLDTHKSETLVRLVASECGIKEDLGVKGKNGVLKNKKTRAEFLIDESHRIRFVYTPKHASWLNQIEIWFSILVRRLLNRGSFKSVEDLRDRILAFIGYFNATMAKPFKWTYKGRPLVA